MTVDEKVLQRINVLVEQGEEVKRTLSNEEVDSELSAQWATSTISFVSRIFGSDSIYVQHLNESRVVSQPWRYDYFEKAFAILNAVKDDLENDALFKVKTLIEAEMFDDFLEQAEHLYSKKYHQPAAVVAGAVLEDGLRKLCVRNGIELGDKPKLDWMNSQLSNTNNNVYNKLQAKNIVYLADIRNNAAHGKWEDFTKEDVDKMLKGVRVFMVEHFS